MNKPYIEFFGIKAAYCVQYADWKNGIRKLSIEYELPGCRLLSEDENWSAPILNWKIFIGPILIHGYVLAGKIERMFWS